MVDPHKHCVVCGKAIPTDKTFCAEKCERYYEKKMKSQKRHFYLLMVFPIIVVLLFLILSWLQS
ncbi:MAG: DUF2116 family Zn-ribbon domain-containing protein [Methanomicrobia archaeon]|nr:DUF2116 family Zn-ribbon domain-containing protein [Methanomicrobia archaeon]MCK4432866.1 DUF2116 family Zn-ribbon domain-containing protein [Methanomicrobia archaeon]MCK4637420.1 DUF2116 family Zn-ribbon domain-containing protein [Methanomicrobia archaeon]